VLQVRRPGNSDIADLEFARVVRHVSLLRQSVVETRTLDHGVAVIEVLYGLHGIGIDLREISLTSISGLPTLA
jgi:hypothetical protein